MLGFLLLMISTVLPIVIFGIVLLMIVKQLIGIITIKKSHPNESKKVFQVVQSIILFALSVIIPALSKTAETILTGKKEESVKKEVKEEVKDNNSCSLNLSTHPLYVRTLPDWRKLQSNNLNIHCQKKKQIFKDILLTIIDEWEDNLIGIQKTFSDFEPEWVLDKHIRKNFELATNSSLELLDLKFSKIFPKNIYWDFRERFKLKCVSQDDYSVKIWQNSLYPNNEIRCVSILDLIQFAITVVFDEVDKTANMINGEFSKIEYLGVQCNCPTCEQYKQSLLDGDKK